MLGGIALRDPRRLLVVNLRRHPSTPFRRFQFPLLACQLRARRVERITHLRHANLRVHERLAHHRKNRAPFRRRGRAVHRVAPGLSHILEHGARPRRPTGSTIITTCAASSRRTRSSEAQRRANGTAGTRRPPDRVAKSIRAPKTSPDRRGIGIRRSAYVTLAKMLAVQLRYESLARARNPHGIILSLRMSRTHPAASERPPRIAISATTYSDDHRRRVRLTRAHRRRRPRSILLRRAP